jgi:cytochrome c oxidase assembly protein subunit 11
MSAPMDPKNKTVLQLAVVILFMGTLAWASVPAYRLFCQVTGWGGATDVADAAPGALDEHITIRFDASKDRGMPWEFKPVELKQRIRIGEEGLAFFEAYNPTSRTIAGTASFNVAPFEAGAYFSKIHCFCFEMQVLEPGQRVQMPVTYFVEPEILDDPDAKHVKEITLSYTFHEAELPEGYAPEQAALDVPERDTENELN